MEPLVSPTPEQEQALLQPLAARLIWWQSPRQSLRRPDRVIAQAMELGDFDSVLHLRQVLGDRRLAAVPRRAQPGWFSPRSGHRCDPFHVGDPLEIAVHGVQPGLLISGRGQDDAVGHR